MKSAKRVSRNFRPFKANSKKGLPKLTAAEVKKHRAEYADNSVQRIAEDLGMQEGFKKFKVVSFIQDSGYGYQDVYLCRLEFKGKRPGLCIINIYTKVFIEEPGDLDDYGFESIEQLKEKYHSL